MDRLSRKFLGRAALGLLCLLLLTGCGSDKSYDYQLALNEEATGQSAPQTFHTLEISLDADAGTAEVRLTGDVTLTGTLSGFTTPLQAGDTEGRYWSLSGTLTSEDGEEYDVDSYFLSTADAVFGELIETRPSGSVMMGMFGPFEGDIVTLSDFMISQNPGN